MTSLSQICDFSNKKLNNKNLYNIIESTILYCSKLILDNNNISVLEKTELISNLEELSLRSNDISTVGSKFIEIILKNNKKLLVLDLYNNTINNMGVIHIMNGNGNILTSLNIGMNEIGPSGAIIVADMLKTNKTLTTLILSNNYIRDIGFAAIIKSLKKNKTLKYLDVGNNDITNVSILYNNTLETLLVDRNKISEYKWLITLVKTTALKNINISYNINNILVSKIYNSNCIIENGVIENGVIENGVKITKILESTC